MVPRRREDIARDNLLRNLVIVRPALKFREHLIVIDAPFEKEITS
jgi:hypothetical protein